MAGNLELFHKEGIDANAMLAERHGFKQLEKVIEQYNVDIVLVPTYFEYPKLVDRLVGNSISQIGETNFKGFFMDQGNGKFATLTAANPVDAEVA